MRERISEKIKNDNDPSEARLDILAAQIKQHEALTDDEHHYTITLDTNHKINSETILALFRDTTS